MKKSIFDIFESLSGIDLRKNKVPEVKEPKAVEKYVFEFIKISSYQESITGFQIKVNDTYHEKITEFLYLLEKQGFVIQKNITYTKVKVICENKKVTRFGLMK